MMSGNETMTLNGSGPSCSITSIRGASGNGSHAPRPSARRGARAGSGSSFSTHQDWSVGASTARSTPSPLQSGDATTTSGRRPWIAAMRRAWPATASHRSGRRPATTTVPTAGSSASASASIAPRLPGPTTIAVTPSIPLL